MERIESLITTELSFGSWQALSRLQKDPQLLKSYSAAIRQQLDCGIIEVITNEFVEGPYKHYIPHHAVITQSKSTT